MKKMKRIFVNAWACLLLVTAGGGFSSCDLGGEEINSYIYNGTKYVYKEKQGYYIDNPDVNSMGFNFKLVGYTDFTLGNERIYIAKEDVEQNVLVIDWKGYVKEGFQFPNILDAQLRMIKWESEDNEEREVNFKLKEFLSKKPTPREELPRIMQKKMFYCVLANEPAFKVMYAYMGDGCTFITEKEYEEVYYEVIGEELKEILNDIFYEKE